MLIQHQGNNNLPAGYVDANVYTADDLIFYKSYMRTRFKNFDDAAFVKGLAVEAALNGRQSPTNTDLNYHIESGSYFQPATVLSRTVSGSGATATCEVTVSQTLVNGGYYSPGKKNQLVFLSDGVTQAFIRSKTESTSSPTTTFVLASAVGETIDWATKVVQNNTLGFYSQISSTGNTEFATGDLFNDTRYETPIMEVMTGSSIVNQDLAFNRFEIASQGGGDAKPYAIDRIMAELLPRHEITKGFHLVWGTGKDYVDSDGKTIKTSMGMYQLGKTFGENFDISPNSINLSYFDNIVASMIARQAGPEVNMYNGHRLNNAIDKFIRPEMQNGGVVYSYFGADSTDVANASKRAIDFGYSSFRYNDFSFHKKNMLEANHPFVTDIGSDPAAVKANSGVWIPSEGGMMSEGAENVYVPSWEVLYKPGRTSIDGTMQRVRVYDRDPRFFAKERFQRCMIENYSLRAFRALKFTTVTGVAG